MAGTRDAFRQNLLGAIADSNEQDFLGLISEFLVKEEQRYSHTTALGLRKQVISSLNQWSIPLDKEETIFLTPLQYAIHHKNKGIIKALLEYSSKPVTQINTPIPNIIGNNHHHYRPGQTAIHIAVLAEDANILEMLLATNQVPNPISAFNAAAVNLNIGDPTVAIADSHIINVSVADAEGKTPLDLANKLQNKAQIIPILTTHGAQYGTSAPTVSDASASSSKQAPKSLHQIVTDLGSQGTDFSELDSQLEQLDNQAILTNLDSNAENILHIATRNGNLKLIQHILDKTPWALSSLTSNKTLLINAKNKNGETCLHIAAANDAIKIPSEITKALLGDLTYGGDVAIKNNAGENPIHKAAEFGSIFLINTLLEKEQKSFEYTDSKNQNVLHFAARRNYKMRSVAKIKLSDAALTLLLQNEKAKTLLNSADSNGDLPIHAAVRNGNVHVLKAILEIDPGQINKINTTTGENLLHIAASVQNDDVDEIITFLVMKNLNINSINATTGDTALHIACRQNNLAAVNALIDLNADIDITNKERNLAEKLTTDQAILEVFTQKRNKTVIAPVTAIVTINKLDINNPLYTKLNTSIDALNALIEKGQNQNCNKIAELTNNFLDDIKSKSLQETLAAAQTYKDNIKPYLDALPCTPAVARFLIGCLIGAAVGVAIGLAIWGGAWALSAYAGYELAFEISVLFTEATTKILAGYGLSALVGGAIAVHQWRPASYTTAVANKAVTAKENELNPKQSWFNLKS